MRFGLVFSVAALAACSDTSIKTVNSGPEAIIASHSTGDTVREGDTGTVIGQVEDADLEYFSVTWLQDGETLSTDSAPDSTGNVLCPMTLAAGGGEVSLMVRDRNDEYINSERTYSTLEPSDCCVESYK
jgi:hypothetical protein